MSDYDKHITEAQRERIAKMEDTLRTAREQEDGREAAATKDPIKGPNQVTGLKYDNGKEPLSLLSRIWLTGVARVLEFGARKYASHNWRGGIERSRLLSAALRHLLAYNEGQDLDPETGLNHLDHASCCLMFARELHETRPDLDDRYKQGST